MMHITRNPHSQMFRGRFGSLDRGHEIDPFRYDIARDLHRPVGAFHPTHLPCRREATIIHDCISDMPFRFLGAGDRSAEKVVKKE